MLETDFASLEHGPDVLRLPLLIDVAVDRGHFEEADVVDVDLRIGFQAPPCGASSPAVSSQVFDLRWFLGISTCILVVVVVCSATVALLTKVATEIVEREGEFATSILEPAENVVEAHALMRDDHGVASVLFERCESLWVLLEESDQGRIERCLERRQLSVDRVQLVHLLVCSSLSSEMSFELDLVALSLRCSLSVSGFLYHRAVLLPTLFACWVAPGTRWKPWQPVARIKSSAIEDAIAARPWRSIRIWTSCAIVCCVHCGSAARIDVLENEFV